MNLKLKISRCFLPTFLSFISVVIKGGGVYSVAAATRRVSSCSEEELISDLRNRLVALLQLCENLTKLKFSPTLKFIVWLKKIRLETNVSVFARSSLPRRKRQQRFTC